MNVRRGLFRLWLVLTALWITGVTAVSWGDVVHPYLPPKAYLYWPPGSSYPTGMNPFEELSYEDGKQPYYGIIEPNSSKISSSEYVQVLTPNSVSIYVAKSYDRTAVKTMLEDFMPKYSAPRDAEVLSKRVAALKTAASVMLIPPLIVLAIGGALVWALSGFKK